MWLQPIHVTVIQTILLTLTNTAIQIVAAQTTSSTSHHQNQQNQNQNRLHKSTHTSNYAIILQSSVFFHNYRHTSNALSIYQSLKLHGGFTDDHILLFLGDEVSCNERNPFKDTILPFRTNYATRDLELQTGVGHVEVDYGGEDVTVDNFLRVLQGRHHPHTPASQRLPSTMDENSNLFIYITGHGGDEFFKFRDKEELTMMAFRRALEEMQFRGRFGKILFVTDTCQAFTLAPNTVGNDRVNEVHPLLDPLLASFVSTAPGPLTNVYTIGSSLKDHNSYSHHADLLIGHSVMDRYVHFLMTYMGWMDSTTVGSKWDQMDQMSVKEALIDSYYDQKTGHSIIGTDLGWTDHGCDIKMGDIPLSDFMVMRRRGAGGGSSSTNGQGEVQVEALAEGVDFTKMAVPPVTNEREDGLESNTGEINGSTTTRMVERQMKKESEGQSSHLGYEQQMGGDDDDGWQQGTNPKDPIFVVSVVGSMLAIWYSSPYLW